MITSYGVQGLHSQINGYVVDRRPKNDQDHLPET